MQSFLSNLQRSLGLFRTVPGGTFQSATSQANDDDDAKTLALIDVTIFDADREELPASDYETQEIFNDGFTIEIRICDEINKYDVHWNLPNVRKVELPKHLLTGFFVSPHLLLDFADYDDCDCQWYRIRTRPTKKTRLNIQNGVVYCGDSPVERSGDCGDSNGWQWIASGLEYKIRSDDADCFLGVVCTARNGERLGCPSVTCTSQPIWPRPEKLLYESRHQLTPGLSARQDNKGCEKKTLTYKIAMLMFLIEMYILTTSYTFVHLQVSCGVVQRSC